MKLGEHAEATKALQNFLRRYQPAVNRSNVATDVRPVLFTRVDLLQDAPSPVPVFAPAPYAPGFAFLKQGKYEDAIARFKEAAAGDSISARSVTRPQQVRRASGHLRLGELDAALVQLKTAVAAAPADAESHRLLGVAYRADEQYGESADAFRAAIRLNRRDERSLIALADVLIAARKSSDAQRALEDATETIAESGQAHYNLGRLYQALGRHRDALLELERAIQIQPIVGLSTLYQAVGVVHFRETSFDMAIAAQAKRIELNPNDALAHRALGELYIQQDRHDEALAEFIAALLIDPRNADAYAAVAQLHQRLGRYADAIEASQRALALDPAHLGARYTRATSLVRLERVGEARSELEVFQRLQSAALALDG